MTVRRIPIAMIIAFAAGAGLSAAEPPAHTCANLRDDAERLTCYDQAFGKSQAASSAPNEPMTPVAAPTPAATTPAAAVATPTAAEVQEFGFKRAELDRKKADAEKTPAAPDRITARISAVEYLGNRFIIALDNGQAWLQVEGEMRVQPTPGDLITVRRAVLGSYLLTGPQKIAVRVQRVK
jgi:hypothetical protein